MAKVFTPVKSQVPIQKIFWIGVSSIFLLKLILASLLDLYRDEIFYWEASTHPALAYSDLPFVTATLVGIGSRLAPGSTLAARIIFILLGSGLPFLIYWIARPLTGSRKALEASILIMCVPLAAFMGLLAVPDVPMIFFGLAAVGFFERALRTDQLSFWVATGCCMAIGLSTHYRFIVYPLSALLFLTISRPYRVLWVRRNLWISILIGLIGLIPVVYFNLRHDFASASFYVIDRHPWHFQAQGLLHVFRQAGVTTPLMYGAFVATLVYLFKRTLRKLFHQI